MSEVARQALFTLAVSATFGLWWWLSWPALRAEWAAVARLWRELNAILLDALPPLKRKGER